MQDIEDPNHLSLEDEKRRTAEEKNVKIVEQNKLKIQRHLAAMKVKFKTLQQRFVSWPNVWPDIGTKSSPIFTKADQLVSTAFLLKNDVFQNIP